MKLVNETGYETADLRRLLQAVITNSGSHKEHKVTVRYSRYRGMISGLASVGGSWVILRVPRDGIDVVRVGRVFLHELGHNLGMRHKEMCNSSHLDVRFLEGITVERKVVIKKDVRALKLAKKRADLERYEKRRAYFIKLYDGKIAKAKRSIVMLERVRVASPTTTPQASAAAGAPRAGSVLPEVLAVSVAAPNH